MGQHETSLVGFTHMFSQGPTPLSAAPNLIAPRFAIDAMLHATSGRKLKDAKCPVLVIMAEDDDIILKHITVDIVQKAEGSE